jgi:acetoin utilization protein AcuC
MGEKHFIYLVKNPEAHLWVLGAGHPTQGRRFAHADAVLESLSATGSISGLELLPARAATSTELTTVHTPEYVSTVVDEHKSGEWLGAEPVLAKLAAEFAGSTLVAADALLNGAKLAVNYPGAKHHAQAGSSSGFCVFADFAMAAKYLADVHGLRVAILDIDAHHGDGTENLTRDHENILTFSIHEGQLFPYTATEYEATATVHNRPLAAAADDSDLVVGVQDFVDVAKAFKADVLLIAAGGDGHLNDPLSNLAYTERGYVIAGELIRSAFPEHPILLGGAGGYRPDDHTPAMWLSMTLALAGYTENEINELDLLNRVTQVEGK